MPAIDHLNPYRIVVRATGANDTQVNFHGHGVLVGPNADL